LCHGEQIDRINAKPESKNQGKQKTAMRAHIHLDRKPGVSVRNLKECQEGMSFQESRLKPVTLHPTSSEEPQ